MTVVTRETLQAQAEQIRLETRARANTADRVGQALRDIVDSVAPSAPVYDVTSPAYGASPSAAAAVNDAAIQAALDAAHSAGGGKVYIPRGRFLITSAGNNVALSFENKQNIWLCGDGIGVTELYLVDGGDAHMVNIAGTASNIVISDMTLNGNRANQTVGVHGIRVTGVDGLWLSRLHIKECYHYGVGMQGTAKRFVFLNALKIENTGGDGIDLKNGDNGNELLVASDIQIEEFGLNDPAVTGQAGFDCRGPWQLSNINVKWTAATGVGVRFRDGETSTPSTGFGGHYSTLNGFKIDGTGATSFGIEAAARGCKVSNGTIHNVFCGVVATDIRNSFCLVDVYDPQDNGFLVGENAHDTEFIGTRCIRSAVGGDSGWRIRADRCKVIGGEAKNNVAGILIEATADSTRYDLVTFTDNTNQIDDSGTGTIQGMNNIGTGAGGMIYNLDNEDVNTGNNNTVFATSILGNKTYIWRYQIQGETSGGARFTRRVIVQGYRSGGGAPVISALTEELLIGTAPTMHVDASGNTAEFYCNNDLAGPVDIQVTTKIWEIDRAPTVEDS